jgi:small subunit ribosomal protein S16
MKRIGRKHRPFYRICAADSRSPRDGRVIEELGTYDPEIADTDARVQWNLERLQYWLGVGAQPSMHVRTFIKKYGPQGTHLAQQATARNQLTQPKVVGPAPAPVFVPTKKTDAPAADAGSAEAAPAEAEAGANS